jgi:exodeoxyribonuclease III
MLIVSYNLNGIRSALNKGLASWLAEVKPDIFCVQETKASLEQVDCAPLEALGYHHVWHSAEKKGYSGVATFSKIKSDFEAPLDGLDRYQTEGRILRSDFGDWTLLNCYFPSGASGDERQAVKIDFLRDFFIRIERLKKERPNLIVVGDYNIAHQEIDIHNPKSNNKTSGFLPEERAWMSSWLESGFVDVFRHAHPDMVQYSWWSTRFNSRASNKGWRIDYQSVSLPMKDKIEDAGQFNDAVHSDHCPVWLKISW